MILNTYFKHCILALILCSITINGQSQHSVKGQTFTMALSGDAIITRKISVYDEPQFNDMIGLIRSADVAFTNLEMLFHDYEMHPMHKSGGTYMRAEPSLAKEIAWAGFDMVSRANNHTGDYGVDGMRLTTKYTAEAGLVQAGVGESLTEAREAKFLETANGRVALISCSATYPDHARAGKSRDDIPSRPGLNPLRFNVVNYITKEQFNELEASGKRLDSRMKKSDDGVLSLFGQKFAVGDYVTVKTTSNRQDLIEIASVVKNASRLADYTIVTFHAHESDSIQSIPAQFLVEFSKEMVDSGADIVVGHGPHILRGIEIYKGVPILYSLGDFIFQNETLLRLPTENYEPYKLGENHHVADFNDARYDFERKGFPSRPQIWESVIAVPKWLDHQLIELRLYPISLGFGESPAVRGRPMFANKKLSKKIIGDLQKLSESYGTEIEFKKGIGFVKLGNQLK